MLFTHFRVPFLSLEQVSLWRIVRTSFGTLARTLSGATRSPNSPERWVSPDKNPTNE